VGDGTGIEGNGISRESEVRCGDCRWWDVADGRSEVDQSEWGRDVDARVSAGEGGVVEVVRRARRREVMGYVRGFDECDDVGESRETSFGEDIER
jgi:hypothetical protein